MQILDLDSMLRWIESMPEIWVQLLLFVSVFLENVFPPWPSDVIILFAGILAARGVVSTGFSFVSILAGNLLGGLLMFYIGQRLILWMQGISRQLTGPRRHFLHRLTGFASPSHFETAGVWMRKYGLWFVFFSRFFAGVRFFVGIVAGASGIPAFLFGISFATGALFWSSLLFFGGKALGHNWKILFQWVQLYNRSFLILLVLLGFAFLILRFRKRKKRDRKAPDTEGNSD